MRFHVGQGCDGVTVDVESHFTQRRMAVLDCARAAVADSEDVRSQRNRPGRRDELFLVTHEVVDVVQSPVLNEQHVATVPTALFEQHTFCAGVSIVTSASTDSD